MKRKIYYIQKFLNYLNEKLHLEGGKCMYIKTEQDIIKLIQNDTWMMGILQTAKSLQLPDWWICAGFVRSKIWDVLHGYEVRTLTPDIDIIYFDHYI